MRGKLGRVLLVTLICLWNWASGDARGEKVCLCQFVAPRYSPIARAARIQGTVRLTVDVDPQGEPVSVSAVEGDPILAEAAALALRNWKFCPPEARENRHLTITVQFKLDGKSTNDWAPTDVTFRPPATVEVVAPPAIGQVGPPDVVIPKP